MKKILYICYMDLNSSGTIGIRNKVMAQINMFKKASYQVDYIWRENGYCKTNINKKLENLECPRIDFLNRLMIANCDFKEYETVYIRFHRFSLSFMSMLKKIKQAACKCIVEIPTYPFMYEDMLDCRNALTRKQFVLCIKYLNKIISNVFWKHLANRYIDRIATYSNDNMIWRIKTLVISNGIEIKEYDECSTNKADSKINLICVSSCLRWHGYDRLIEGLNNYYEDKKESEPEVTLNIVGDGEEVDVYKSMIENYNLHNIVSISGRLVGELLYQAYANSDIAIDALGRHRVGVYYNSSLKGKEYAERGLPIVSGVKTELDYAEDFPFYFRVPADDSPIDVRKIVQFYYDMQDIPKYRMMIRNYAMENFEYSAAMKTVLNYISQ